MSSTYVYKHSLILKRHTVIVHLSHLFPLGDYPSDVNSGGSSLVLIHYLLLAVVDVLRHEHVERRQFAFDQLHSGLLKHLGLHALDLLQVLDRPVRPLNDSLETHRVS